jgi:hypothetical protein
MTRVDAPSLDAIFADGATVNTANGVFLTSVEELGEINLPSGQLYACDPFMALDPERTVPYAASVSPGRYPVHVARVRRQGSQNPRVVAAKLVIADEPAHTLELDDERPGYGVDAGAGCFIDPESVPVFHRLHNAGPESPIQRAFSETTSTATATILADAASGHTMAVFSSGIGDGYYPTWIGRSASGQVVCFVTQFLNPNA